VREIALARFGESNLPGGRPLAELEEVLAPLYFHHRYQLEAAVKKIGGMESRYAVRDDGQIATRIVPAAEQRRALASVLSVLAPERLDLPEETLALLPPRPFGWSGSRETFDSATWPAFDGLGAAAAAADHAAGLLLTPERLARVEDFHRRHEEQPSVAEVLDALIETAFREGKKESERLRAVRRAMQQAVADRLLAAAADPAIRASVRAEVEWALAKLADRLDDDEPHGIALARDVRRVLELEVAARTAPPDRSLPPGSPIGCGAR
jgi:hypothetical protein